MYVIATHSNHYVTKQRIVINPLILYDKQTTRTKSKGLPPHANLPLATSHPSRHPTNRLHLHQRPLPHPSRIKYNPTPIRRPHHQRTLPRQKPPNGIVLHRRPLSPNRLSRHRRRHHIQTQSIRHPTRRNHHAQHDAKVGRFHRR